VGGVDNSTLSDRSRSEQAAQSHIYSLPTTRQSDFPQPDFLPVTAAKAWPRRPIIGVRLQRSFGSTSRSLSLLKTGRRYRARAVRSSLIGIDQVNLILRISAAPRYRRSWSRPDDVLGIRRPEANTEKRNVAACLRRNGWIPPAKFRRFPIHRLARKGSVSIDLQRITENG
jgi:hypothetical protein